MSRIKKSIALFLAIQITLLLIATAGCNPKTTKTGVSPKAEEEVIDTTKKR